MSELVVPAGTPSPASLRYGQMPFLPAGTPFPASLRYGQGPFVPATTRRALKGIGLRPMLHR